MGPPPLLVDLCCLETATLITRDYSRYEDALELPFDLLNKVLLHLPPLPLHHFQQYVLIRLKEACPELDFSVAWKNLLLLRHPDHKMRNYMYQDWEQLYWEADIQACLDSVTTRVSLEGQKRHPTLPGLVRHAIEKAIVSSLLCTPARKIWFGSTHSIQEFSDCQFLSLRTPLQICRYVKSLRIRGVLCSEELRDFLRSATLETIAFRNVSTSAEFSNAFQILATQTKSLKRLEFFHCTLSEEDLNTLCDISFDLERFSIVESDILLSAPTSRLGQFFRNNRPTSRLGQFLRNNRSLSSMELCDNKVDSKFKGAMVLDLLSQTSASLSSLALNENELDCDFQVNQFWKDCSRRQQTFLPGLTILNLSDCRLNSDCMQNLVHYLKCLPLLETLDLSFNDLGDEGTIALGYCFETSMFSLKELDVGNCDLSCGAVSFLLDALVSSPVTLKSLSISGNDLGKDVSTSLARFLEKSTLEVLDISEIGLGSLGCSSELALSLVSNRNLMGLDISKNRIAAGGAELLHAVISKGVLTSISARSNCIRRESMKPLATALRLNSGRPGKIRRLDLRKNPGCKDAHAFCWFESFVEGPEPVVLLVGSNKPLP